MTLLHNDNHPFPPYPAYKDSGVEWIGEIPEHWHKKDLNHVPTNERYSLTGGPFGSDLKHNEYTPEGVRIIQLQNIGVGRFIDKYKIYTSEAKADALSACNIFPGEIIIAKMADPVARACKMPSQDRRYLMASDGIRLKVDEDNFNTDFIVYTLNSSYFRYQAELYSSGTTRLRI
jgi:type I restriction enzyme S subunit